MTCEHVRWQLSLDPAGTEVAHDPALRRHLDGCPRCRAFAQALATVDDALAARPLASPRPGFATGVVAAARRRPNPAALEQPFPRAFVAFAAAVTLVALVGGALLLHYSTTAWPPAAAGAAELWFNPSWPNDASAWLSVEAGHAAQAILAALAGLVISVVAAAAGFRASDRRGVAHQPAKPPR